MNKKQKEATRKFFEPTMEQPKKRFNWRALMLVVIILAVVFVIVGLVGTILSLKEEVAWFEDNKTVYCLTK